VVLEFLIENQKVNGSNPFFNNFISFISYFYIFLMLSFTLLDSSSPWQLYFQDAASPVMEGIINLHHDLMFFITFILFFVLVVMGRTFYFFKENSVSSGIAKNVVHGTTIEIIWTVIPSIILIIVALPSFALLYSIDEIIDPALTIKCIGHQWYWSYEYSDFESQLGVINFDSYMVPEDELEIGELRLLEVDNRIVLPINTHIRILVTASDVLHSWAIPSLGVKLDACAGRLNQTSLFILREGVFYGQCSEICGVGHGNMPIVVESVPVSKYITWLSEKI
jgi:cytochrome c oxidase subunit 2